MNQLSASCVHVEIPALAVREPQVRLRRLPSILELSPDAVRSLGRSAIDIERAAADPAAPSHAARR